MPDTGKDRAMTNKTTPVAIRKAHLDNVRDAGRSYA